MLALKFQVGSDWYAIDCRCVIEVIPWVELRALPHAPAQLKGLLYYRGQVVPVLDVAVLLGSNACQPRLSTRIIVASRASDIAGPTLVGLLAERISDLVSIRSDSALITNVSVPRAPYLGAVIRANGDLVQIFIPDRVVAGDLAPAAEASS